MEPETIEYGGWSHCLKLSNGEVEVVATTDVGPRLIRYGFVGERNEFKEFEKDRGQTGGDEWRPYGGHRLWHAPEVMPRTYAPDNSPIAHEFSGQWLSLRPPVEESTGIQKQIDVYLAPSGSHVKIVHRLTNRGLWAVELSAWALTVMAAGGRAIFPQEPFVPFPDALLPARPMVLWTYTQMQDERWTWGNRYLQLRQSETARSSQKIGLLNKPGWAAYQNGDHVFIKRFHFFEDARYPDFGCNFESYTDSEMLEVETLGALTRLEPGATLDHSEHWFLYKDVSLGETDEELAQSLPSLLEQSERDMRL